MLESTNDKFTMICLLVIMAIPIIITMIWLANTYENLPTTRKAAKQKLKDDEKDFYNDL